MTSEYKSNSIFWNPWHGCTKISPGCKHCYVYRRDEACGNPIESSICRKNKDFNMPVQKRRDGSFKLEFGSEVYTCFTSDFLLADADEWRPDCWRMMRERADCHFIFFTKRIDRFADCLPADWGNGYPNVTIGCTVENQDRADYRLPIFKALPIREKYIIVESMLEQIDISKYLDNSISNVSAGGESGDFARVCNYDWVLDLRRQCVEHNVSFSFHQTGANFVKDGRAYKIERYKQQSQAAKACIDFAAKTKADDN